MEKPIQRLIDELPKSITDSFVPAKFEIGEHIIEIHSKVKYGYLFIEGAIDVMHENSKDILFTYCQDYYANFVGLMEIYSGNDTYCCTCRARKKCVGYRVSKDVYLKMLDECEFFKTYLIKYWANQFYSQALNRTQYPNNRSEEKTVNYLSQILTKMGDANKTVEIVIKRADIAEYIGCSKRTIYRVLQQLEEDGYLNKKGHRIVVNPTQRNLIINKEKKNIEK